MSLICEECDRQNAQKYCSSCDQKLCKECDIRIHNKSKRALHVRTDISQEIGPAFLDPEIRQKLSKAEVLCQGDLRITVFQKLSGVSDEMKEKEVLLLQSITMEYFLKEAYKGNLMHPLDQLQAVLYKEVEKHIPTLEYIEFENLFSILQQSKVLHVTVRKFGDSKPLQYASLVLGSVSLESLVWILLSIRSDKMKPTDKLVLSRIKEFFSLRISQKDWNTAMDFFYLNGGMLQATEHLPQIQLFDDKETASKMQSRSETEFTNKDDKLNSSYRLELKGVHWDYEDVLEVDEASDSDWMNFKVFIDNFFVEEVGFGANDSRSKLKKQKNTKNIQKWLSSVENDLTKPSGALTANHSIQKILSEQSINRAIPGGKYGCALMIKLTGPPELQPLSLGKLSSFVQKALNQNILIYYKTLLIKNNQFDAGNSNASQEAKNGKRVETIKEQILALLKENKNGLSLAQIPLMLKNKYKKTYNIQSLGFPKLKNLLVTMDEVDLEKTQGNLLKAVLKSHVRKNSEKQLEEQPQKPNNLGGKKFLTLKSRPLDHRLTSMPYYIGQSPAGFSQDSAPPTKSYRTLSNVGDYILKVQMMLLEILQLNPFGIEVTKLNSELDKRLGGTGFQPTRFCGLGD